MNVVIVGSNGQLGTELQKILKNGESELGKMPGIYHGSNVTAVDIDTLDISDKSAVNKFVVDNKPDIIINCAAMTNVDQCDVDVEQAMKANAIGPRNLAEASKKEGCKLVHVSTDYVFAGNGSTPYREWDVCNPKSGYGSSKLQGENYIRDFADKYFIVRTAWLYGYKGGNFVKTMLRLAMRNGTATVVNDQRGNPTNAVDLAHHLLELAVTEEYGVYHCTCNGECSWYDFTCKIMEEFGIECDVMPCTSEEFAQKYPNSAKRPSYSSLDNLMLRSTIGDGMRTWQDAIHAYAKNYDINELKG